MCKMLCRVENDTSRLATNINTLIPFQSTPVGSLQTTGHEVVVSPNRERHISNKVCIFLVANSN